MGSVIDDARGAPEAMDAAAGVLGPVVRRFADSSVRNEVGTGLDGILRNAQALLNSFSTQPGVVFTISNPKIVVNAPLKFVRDFMKSGGGGGDGRREVGILVFPGLFKIRGGKRVCMFKAKVICRGEAGL